MPNKPADRPHDQFRAQRELSDEDFSLFGPTRGGKKNKRDKDFKVVREKKERIKLIWL